MAEPLVLGGPGQRELARAVAARLGVEASACIVDRFPDGELRVEVTAHVRGADVYIVQPTSPPADPRLVELLFLADACRLSGADRITAVVPYLGYARQDRRTAPGTPLGARLVGSLVGASGVARVVALDLHSPQVEAAFPCPVEHLSAVPILAEALGRSASTAPSVVVSPDLGAARLAERYATLLGLPMAVVHKTRLGAAEVAVRAVTGDVRGRRPIIVDDMISTGSTIEAALNAVIAAGAKPPALVAATHLVLPVEAAARLRASPIEGIVATDSIDGPTDVGIRVTRVSVAPLLADAIGRLNRREPIRELVARR